MIIRDLFTITRRLPYLLPSVRRRYPNTPLPWARCHCGALAEWRDPLIGDLGKPGWCWPCKYACHETCDCSCEETTDDQP